MSRLQAWRVVYYLLLAGIVVTGALNMMHVHAGFFTNHAADVVVPAWLYVAARNLHSVRNLPTFIQRTIGHTPEIAAVSLFTASTFTEVSQFFWPHGIFPGRFDAFDVLAYFGGLSVCYAAERLWPIWSHGVADAPDERSSTS